MLRNILFLQIHVHFVENKNLVFRPRLNSYSYFPANLLAENILVLFLRTVPTIFIVHTFCASRDIRISYQRCLLIQGYFCVV